ncbi:MAG TPA: DUF3016 domain-containing protein [Micropepsaceae bacterium]|jgi:hypothetical protein
MRTLVLFAAAIVTGTWPFQASAAVIVNFIQPEHYTDAGPQGQDRTRNLNEIERTFQKLGEHYLSADQILTIDVLDVDLAGRLEPWHANAYDVRYLRDITWPRMKLRDTLETPSQPPQSAEEILSDPSYLESPNTRFSGEPLAYDKAMIERWFHARFVEHRPPHH